MPNINQTPYDENGNEHGEWLSYYDNDLLRYRHNYFHGIQHGFYEYYYQNGTLMYRGYYNMGKGIGYWCFNDEHIKYYYLCLI